MLDIYLGRGRKSRCDGATRRDFLRAGGLGALGLSLSKVLELEALAAQPAAARAKSVILVYLGGGMSHHDSFDYKAEAPEEIRGKYQAIQSNVPGTVLGQLLPQMAQKMDKVALVRSGAHNNDHHETATNWVLSGRFGSAFGDYPAIGAVAAHQLGFQGVLPPYMAVPRNPSFTWELGKSAFLGGRYESFKVGDPSSAGFKVRDVAAAEPLSQPRAQRRQSLLEAVDGLSRRVRGNDQIATYDEFRQRAADMLLSPEAQGAFAIDREDPRLRDRYGMTTFGQSCLMSRRLIEGGVRFVTINFGGWDHHAKIWEGLENRLPDFDRGFSALLEDLETRGLMKDTFVAAFGEFGRSPKVNKDVGRDHWAPAASMLFAGAGVQGGKLIGATDKEGGYVTTRPVAPADVAYTIYQALGIDPRALIHTPDGRPLEILDSGRNLDELFS